MPITIDSKISSRSTGISSSTAFAPAARINPHAGITPSGVVGSSYSSPYVPKTTVRKPMTHKPSPSSVPFVVHQTKSDSALCKASRKKLHHIRTGIEDPSSTGAAAGVEFMVQGLVLSYAAKEVKRNCGK